MFSSHVSRADFVVTLLVMCAGLLFSPITEAETEEPGDSEVAIAALSQRWRSAVSNQDPALVEMLSSASTEHYRGLQHAALYAQSGELQKLPPTDQLQALFFRLMLQPGELKAMSEQDVIAFAVKEGMIGSDLRESDELRELAITEDSAQGRLYKFGRDERPDRGLQYFVYEEGSWHVDLRSELERLENDFDAFVSRSKLGPDEAAFFILEARLFRKVTPEDFVPPLDPGLGKGSGPQLRHGLPPEEAGLRVVSIRSSLDDPDYNAVTIESRPDSLHHVLRVGDSLPPTPRFLLYRMSGDEIELRAGEESRVLRLERDGDALHQRSPEIPAFDERNPVSLLGQAELGEHREGLMAQWRNVGLRGRPQLLQQVWFNPVRDSEGAMLGLKARNLVAGSFWHQIGLEEDDLLIRFNGQAVDSMKAWQDLLIAASTELEIVIEVKRGEKKMRFQTRTIRP
jgi:hypothetical protein